MNWPGVLRRDLIVVGAGAFFALLPMMLSGPWVRLLTLGVLLGGFALALDLLVGQAGLTSLGHGAFFGLGGYAAALSIVHLGVEWGWAIIIGFGVGTVVTLAFGAFAVRLSGLAFLTVTLAFGQLLWGLAIRWTSFTGGENGIFGVGRPTGTLLGLRVDTVLGFYLLAVATVTVVSLLVVRIAASPVGLSIRGQRDSQPRLVVLGYSVHARRLVAFVVAGAVGSLYGVFAMFHNNFVGPQFLGWRLSAEVLLAVVVGGAGSLWGPFVAGVGLYLLRVFLTGQTELWVMVMGLLYITSVLLLPGGIASLPARFSAAWSKLAERVPARGRQ